MSAARRPVAFLSYVRSDDDHDEGAITAFRRRLEGEVQMHTGEPFPIFQDRNDILWGQNWEDRINSSISDVSFLIPVVTPSFFRSRACLGELEMFRQREELFGTTKLILPLYYVTAEEIEESTLPVAMSAVSTIKSRQWTDWRAFRFKRLDEEATRESLASLARTISSYMRELQTLEAKQETPGIAPYKSDPPLYRIDSEAPKDGGRSTQIERASGLGKTARGTPPKRRAPYHPYTTKFDEVVEATDLVDITELDTLFKYLNQRRLGLRFRNRRLYNSLVRDLTKSASTSDIAVTILVDNSGSMRGDPALKVGASLLNLIESFDKIGASLEILGFTTRAWRGGKSREKWLKDGRPPQPGRLNDLRHIVYKSFRESSISSAMNVGLIIREGLLKENIDGEALLWAAGRLGLQPKSKKVLIVISDGAPVDDSTLSVNSGDYLSEHLKQSIGEVSDGQISLAAVGIGHPVGTYYPNSVVSMSLEDIDLLVLKAIYEIANTHSAAT